MAVTKEALDGIDDATVQLILQLQLEDIESEIDSTDSPPSPVAQPGDYKVAKDVFKAELEKYLGSRSFTVTEPEPSPEEEIVLYECVVCEHDFDADHCYQLPCEDYYCHSDLNELFRIAMINEKAYPPRCCGRAVPFEEVKHLLNKTLAKEFGAKKEEMDDPVPTYCHVRTCSSYIGQDHKDKDIATCPQCEAKMCIPCKEAHHDGDCALDEAMEKTLTLAEKEGWQKCPQCERIVELTVGCNHMV